MKKHLSNLLAASFIGQIAVPVYAQEKSTTLESEIEQSFLEQGFSAPVQFVVDNPEKTSEQQMAEKMEVIQSRFQRNAQELKTFKGLYGFRKKSYHTKWGDRRRPWRYKKFAGMISDNPAVAQKVAMEFALEMQKYVYEGWFDQLGKTVDTNDLNKSDEHFKSNNFRTWCSAPWLNKSARKGREFVHGLTKEFPLSSSGIFPGLEFVEHEVLRKPHPEKKGKTIKYSSLMTPEAEAMKIGQVCENSNASWGVAFFNKKNCDLFQDIYVDKTKTDPNDSSQYGLKDPRIWKAQRQAEAQSGNYEGKTIVADGAVSFKLLFSTVRNIEAFNGDVRPYKLFGDVSIHRHEVSREINVIPHVQMDIAIKDAKIPWMGDKFKKIPWMMLTYYFDPSYQMPAKYLEGKRMKFLPKGLQTMRPVGVQWGLDAGDSIILDGAKNNHRIYVETTPEGKKIYQEPTDIEQTRLNGPADDPKQSCLGCHAAAGVPYKKVSHKMRTEGVLESELFNEEIVKDLNYDFNHQVRIGIGNFEKHIAGKIDKADRSERNREFNGRIQYSCKLGPDQKHDSENLK